MKTKRNLAVNNRYEITDELYNELSSGQQLLAAMAEASGVDMPLAEFQGRYFVPREVVAQLWEIVFE